jgi:hypothetical protein
MEGFLIDDDDLAIRKGACRGHRSPAGERANLAGETAGAMRAQESGALNGPSGRFDRSGKNGEHPRMPVAFRIEDVVGFQLAPLAVSLQYRQLRFVQRGIHLMVAAAA